MRTKSNQSKLMKIITLPARVLKKGKEMYVRSMMDVAQKPRYSSSSRTKASVPGQQVVSGYLPKSFSTSVTTSRSTNYEENDDLRELIRANSTAHNKNSAGLDVEGYLKQLIEEQKMSRQKLYNDRFVEQSVGKVGKGVPRSQSVGLGRIDEGKACEFDEEEEGVEEEQESVRKLPEVMLRSRSHAVGVAGRNNSLVF